MGLLKRKIKGETLIETLVATSIIIVVFVIASLVLNNTVRTLAAKDTFEVRNRLEVLQYLYTHNKLTLPYDEVYDTYQITIYSEESDPVDLIIYEAQQPHQKTKIRIQKIDETIR